MKYKKFGQRCERVFLQDWEYVYPGINDLYENSLSVESQEFQLRIYQD